MNAKEYNGWTNYETWLVKLWRDNEPEDYHYWRDAAREIPDSHAGKVSNLANDLRAHYQDAAADKFGTAGLFSDLIGAALGEVNWREIAEHLLEEVANK